jgi:ribonucleoside-diphosphate reductase alpha subunit
MNKGMRVIKRDGHSEDVDFNKITNRIRKLCNEIGTDVIDPIIIAQKVCNALHDNVRTTELDKLTSEIATSMITKHYDYGTLAAYIVASDMHKNMKHSFSEGIKMMYENGFLCEEVYEVVQNHKKYIEKVIDYRKDYDLDYFALKTLEKNYLQKVNGIIVERPQDMFMRVSLGIHGSDIEEVINTYNGISERKYTHATPTLFNSGSKKPQLASCFLMAMESDSIKGIYNTLSDCAQISKWAGGIGLHIHNVRGSGSSIRGAKGACTGIVPMLKVFNDTARYVNQEGKRPGSFAIYLQVDHPDIMSFLDLRKNSGDEEERARDLFYAAWIPDLFMERVKKNEKWSLFCPHECPGLADVCGEEYKQKYEKYENEGKARKVMNAQELWNAICVSQIETGTPYMLYKDAANEKSNQKNLGVIKSSNLCCEILEYSDKDETAVCNLASICLSKFVNGEKFDYDGLHEVARQLTVNLNKVIDKTFYPTDKAKRSNTRHRPIGIGVQGLADAYSMMGYPFDSKDAKELNEKIFETIYHGAVEKSMELAKVDGTYETFDGSPMSKGEFQFNLWSYKDEQLSGMYDWEKLRQDVMKYGVRNSLLVAPMPTATTSQIMGNNEAFEPYTSNIYLRRTVAGEFVVINKHLMKDLIKEGLWTTKMKDKIVYNEGSVQKIPEIPDDIKEKYKTAWEISQKVLIEQSADRGKFICQTQSLNLFVPKPSVKILSSMHFYAWSKGLKTGMYYLRTKPAANTQQFTIDANVCEACSG